MNDKTEILKKLDDMQLIKVVANYRAYGYDETVRKQALCILEERGISSDELKMRGEYEDHLFAEAEQLYRSYVFNSNIALICYLGTAVLLVLNAIPETQHWITYVTMGLVILVFVTYFFRANLAMEEFLDLAGGDDGIERERSDRTLMYFSLAVYAVVLLTQRKRMRTALRRISRKNT